MVILRKNFGKQKKNSSIDLPMMKALNCLSYLVPGLESATIVKSAAVCQWWTLAMMVMEKVHFVLDHSKTMHGLKKKN